MRRGHRLVLALLGLLMLLEAGCLRKWQSSCPNPNYSHDPLLQRRDFPQGSQPPAGFNGDPGRPEILTPQAPSMEPGPGGAMPPNSSGYVPPLPGLGAPPAQNNPVVPGFGRTNDEPPLA